MTEKFNFDAWASNLKLSQVAQKCISTIRESEPSRRVKSSKGAVSGRYPSKKMGVTIQFESHKNELAYIYELEQNEQVLEYYDQPPCIPLKYKSLTGRNIGFNHTPDFFILGYDEAGWVECKTEEKLLELNITQPNRFIRDRNGNWKCPPGEKYASQFGLSYKVWSSKNFNIIFQRNIEYLEDYFRATSKIVDDTTKQAIFACIESKLAISLLEIYERLNDQCTRDQVLSLIAHKEIFVDLYDAPLAEANLVKVFLHYEAAQAYSNISHINLPTFEKVIKDKIVVVEIGKSISWDGKIWRIANVGATNITLVDDFSASSDIPLQIFDELVRIGKINGIPVLFNEKIRPDIIEQLRSASRENLEEANRRYSIVKAHLQGSPLPFEVSKRTLYRWTSSHQRAEKNLGYGFLGLLSKPRLGNTTEKISVESKKLLHSFLQKSYATIKQKRKNIVYEEYKSACKTAGINYASYKTFIKELKKIPRDLLILKRQGHKAAYQQSPFYWRLQRDTPRHGEHPFHIVHIDYTEVDVEMRDSYTGKEMGKVWLGLAISASSRRILAIYLSYDAPSKATDMMLFREIVRKFGRMPQIIVVDGGKNFEGVYFETLLAFFECTKKTRPPSEPRFGSVIERIFGTINTQFFHNLLGNTQIMKLVRQVTKSVHPKNHAVWTLPKLWDYLCIYCYEIYDKIPHPALGQSPREEFELQMQIHGNRSHRIIPYDENFKLLTLPTTPRGTAKIIPSLGIKINYIYYWADSFYDSRIENTKVDIRFDPFNIGRSYAYIYNEWIECYSEYQGIFNGLSENLLKLITQELRQRKKNQAKQFSIIAADIANFLQTAESEETVLQQLLKDNQQKYVQQIINNEPVSALKTFLPKAENQMIAKFSHPLLHNEKLLKPASPTISETFKTFEEEFDV